MKYKKGDLVVWKYEWMSPNNPKEETIMLIKEIIKDYLVYPEHAKELIDWVKTFPIITMDILTAIIKEVNNIIS